MWIGAARGPGAFTLGNCPGTIHTPPPPSEPTQTYPGLRQGGAGGPEGPETQERLPLTTAAQGNGAGGQGHFHPPYSRGTLRVLMA